jgi:hypothetical protein
MKHRVFRAFEPTPATMTLSGPKDAPASFCNGFAMGRTATSNPRHTEALS